MQWQDPLLSCHSSFTLAPCINIAFIGQCFGASSFWVVALIFITKFNLVHWSWIFNVCDCFANVRNPISAIVTGWEIVGFDKHLHRWCCIQQHHGWGLEHEFQQSGLEGMKEKIQPSSQALLIVIATRMKWRLTLKYPHVESPMPLCYYFECRLSSLFFANFWWYACCFRTINCGMSSSRQMLAVLFFGCSVAQRGDLQEEMHASCRIAIDGEFGSMTPRVNLGKQYLHSWKMWGHGHRLIWW